MKKTFAILVASTALAIGAGIPAWSGMHRAEHASARTDDDGILKLASDDRLDRDHGRKARSDDDDHRYGDDGHDDDDDDETTTTDTAGTHRRTPRRREPSHLPPMACSAAARLPRSS